VRQGALSERAVSEETNQTMKKTVKEKPAAKTKSCRCEGQCRDECDCGPDKERCTCGGKGPGHKKAKKK